MEVSAEAIAKVPGENLRVSRADFGVLWALAEHLGSQPYQGRGDRFVVGVIWTCRWLARQPVWSPIIRRWEMPSTPLTERHQGAMPETIEAEYMAALTARPFERGLASGVAETLAWAWYGSGRPPLDISPAAVG